MNYFRIDSAFMSSHKAADVENITMSDVKPSWLPNQTVCVRISVPDINHDGIKVQYKRSHIHSIMLKRQIELIGSYTLVFHWKLKEETILWKDISMLLIKNFKKEIYNQMVASQCNQPEFNDFFFHFSFWTKRLQAMFDFESWYHTKEDTIHTLYSIQGSVIKFETDSDLSLFIFKLHMLRTTELDY